MHFIGSNALTVWCSPGLERTDNNMELSSWPQIPPINQKNYYTYVVRLHHGAFGGALLGQGAKYVPVTTLREMTSI